jgi:hypothetical protein
MFFAAVGMISIPTYNTINVLTTTNYLSSANSMVTVPALDFSNVTTAGAMYSSDGSLTTINTTGLKVAHTLFGAGIGATELANYFANLSNTAGANVLTITSVPGATTVQSQSVSSVTAGNSTINMANTVGLVAGQIVISPGGATGMGTGNRVASIAAANSVITLTTAYPPANTTLVAVATAPGTVTGYTQYAPYYVVNSGVAGANSFQISSSNGGSNIAFSGTTQTVNIIYSTFINTVNANSNVVLSNPVTAATVSGTWTFRSLDVSKAIMKNWTITG